MIDYTRLTEDLVTARRVATIVGSETSGVGTCNFDSLAIRVGRGLDIGRVSKKFKKALSDAGIEFYPPHHGCVTLSFGIPINGNARTQAMRAADGFMKSCGWQTTVQYIMD